jgi:hypothetical protein
MWRRTAAGNSTFAIGGVSCFADSFVVKASSQLRMNICAKKARPSQICKPLGQMQKKKSAESAL